MEPLIEALGQARKDNRQTLVVAVNGKEEETWTVFWVGDNIVGLRRNNQIYLPPSHTNIRATFFRTLSKPGYRERIEFRGSNLNSLTGDIRTNVEAWWFDDWELNSLFRVCKVSGT
eukprot:TRINITY_DN1290_c0_g1_i1.p2 TRINITY_DN1290_c0_g1~~TRINITY_DN1290_c0_g1_i1.p2  ORF type:complete len:116 (-),score=13.63 TRINITY_DN1290_c0_g1_i1:48-395(-)